jgi:7,8-dihydro-6-hydroxymethylpterin dimethyltransferase
MPSSPPHVARLNSDLRISLDPPASAPTAAPPAAPPAAASASIDPLLRAPDAAAFAAARPLHLTTSLCKVCKNGLPAQVVALPSGAVWMRKRCPDHGEQAAFLSDDADWYVRTRAIQPLDSPPSPASLQPVHHGCPFDCGPCDLHTQRPRLPIITITSACNLDCPICYVHNKNEHAFHMPLDEFKATVARLLADLPTYRSPHSDRPPAIDLLNLTGGDPTLHPHLFELLEVCRDAGIHRVALCTNGIRLAKSEAYVQRLKALDARVALSFDSFEPAVDVAMQGVPLLDTKLRALDVLEKYAVNTTLIPVITRGMNDHELGRIIDLFLRRPHIRHLELHTITYTGQGGVSFDPSRSGRISMREVLTRIEAQTHGLLRVDDFVPSPCAHPLCYQIAYLLLDPDGGPPVPFTRFMPRDTFYACLHDHLYLEPSPLLEHAIQDAINDLWTRTDDDTGADTGTRGGEDAAHTLRLLRRLLTDMFPVGKPLSRAEALQVGEMAVKAIYVHSHMDEENFDTERVAQCCDSNCYPDGSTIPVCSSNVLYRDKEARFMRQPLTWSARSGGRLSFDPDALTLDPISLSDEPL